MTGRKLSAMGKRIADACEDAGISPTAAERRAGFAQGNLNRIMHGESGNANVNAVKMKALADLLGVAFEWLVLGSGSRTPIAPDTHQAIRDVLTSLLDERRAERVVSREPAHERKQPK